MGGQVERLLKVVPDVSGRPSTTPSASEKSLVRPPVLAPADGGSLDQQVEFAAMKAKLEAFELAEERRQAEFEAMQSEVSEFCLQYFVCAW